MRANIPVWLFNTLCVIAIIALFVAIVGIGVLISNALEPKDGYNKVHLTYNTGCIDHEDGQILNAKNKLYTDDLIECTAFRIVRDYSVKANYEIHYYTEKGDYLPSATVVTSDLEYEVTTMPAGAVGIRLVIVPGETDVDLTGLINITRGQYAGMLELEATNEQPTSGGTSGGVTELAA
ncbi:MAG: hypothetical protein E7461_00605 [Ruminococcaceae bacterium]|nr:hypothetical protein [Oscillospiraceae bacterium]